MDRILVHVQWRPTLDPDLQEEERDHQWDELVGPLFERVGALGGRVLRVGERVFLVDFSWDGLRDAIDFLVDAPLAPELAAGVCHGEFVVLHDTGRLALAVGPQLRRVAEFAQLARPGEVLISPEMVQAAAGRIKTSGEAGTRPGRPNLTALVLDLDQPMVDSCAPQDIPFLADSGEVVEGGQKLLNDEFLLTNADDSINAPRRRDAQALHELAQTVRENHAAGSAERLDAMAEMADGKRGEALRRLRRSKEGAVDGDASTRCRAALALGVALSSAGRTYEAALEGLEAIARAREGEDERGEKACARFLCQLANHFQDEQSAQSWSQLAER